MRLDQVLTRGTHAARPAANTLPNGALYYETDTQAIFQVQAAAWVAYEGNATASPGIDAAITTATLVGKTMTFTKGRLTGFA